MVNPPFSLFRLKISFFLSFSFFLPLLVYPLYWNGRAPLSLPFAGQGVTRAYLEFPFKTNIELSFLYSNNFFIIIPLENFSSSEQRDGRLILIYPWTTKTYQLRLQPLPPIASFLHLPTLGRGKSGLIIYRITAHAPFQTWIKDSTGLVYHPIEQSGLWICLVGWPLKASSYKLTLVVEDAAKNLLELPIPYASMKTSYRVRNIVLGPDFSQNQGKEVGFTNLSGDVLKDYNTLMNEFAKQTKVSIFDLTYRQPNKRQIFFTNLAFLPITQFSTSSLYGDERRFLLNGKIVRTSYHHGIDFVAPENTPIFASWPGTVLFADYNGASGNTIVIDHGLGLHSVYMHLDSFSVKSGDVVYPGQQLGIIGKSGYSTGVHLHFGLSIQGRYVDPSDWTNLQWIETQILQPLQTHIQRPSH